MVVAGEVGGEEASFGHDVVVDEHDQFALGGVDAAVAGGGGSGIRLAQWRAPGAGSDVEPRNSSVPSVEPSETTITSKPPSIGRCSARPRSVRASCGRRL